MPTQSPSRTEIARYKIITGQQSNTSEVLPLKIHLSRVEGCDLINRFNTAIVVCLAKARTWISIGICHGFNLTFLYGHQDNVLEWSHMFTHRLVSVS